MSTIAEIEAAIAKLPQAEVEELAAWLEKLCAQRTPPPPLESWLTRARGAARPGVSTDGLMSLTRGEG